MGATGISAGRPCNPDLPSGWLRPVSPAATTAERRRPRGATPRRQAAPPPARARRRDPARARSQSPGSMRAGGGGASAVIGQARAALASGGQGQPARPSAGRRGAAAGAGAPPPSTLLPPKAREGARWLPLPFGRARQGQDRRTRLSPTTRGSGREQLEKSLQSVVGVQIPLPQD